ncbi:MAG: FHA domain-containing protein [Gammaproteobacteria bacterium]|jgi:type II secretory pathway predicted ATPase ExeA
MTGAEAFRHFGMSRNPFVGKRPELDFYTGPQHRDALAFLDHALHSNDLLLALTGDPGAGKRMTLQVALARGLPGAVEAHVSGGVNEPLEFLSAVLEGFGFGGITASRDEMRGLLQVFFNHERQKGITTVIVAEQLEAVPAGLMEELNWLSLLEPVRAGRLKLALLGDERLERQMFAPRMQALRQMVRWQHRLEPLGLDEARDYLEFHAESAGCPDPSAVFSPGALGHIHGYSGGVPLQIDRVAAHAVEVAARAGADAVLREHVSRERLDESVGARPRRRSVAAMDIMLEHEPKARIRLNTPRLLLGRHPWNDVQLDHDSVSRYHAMLVRESGHWTVVDLNSTNGIRVNDHQVRQQRLHHGDVVHIGRFRLILNEGSGPMRALPSVGDVSDTVILD